MVAGYLKKLEQRLERNKQSKHLC